MEDSVKTNILKIIDENDVIKLKTYIERNNIELRNLNHDKFDILIYAIEHMGSSEMVDFIIHQCHYSNINYTFDYSGTNSDTNLFCSSYRVPLFMAVCISNFKVADVMIKKYHANINYKTDHPSCMNMNIMQYLLHYSNYFELLNYININYVLNNGFSFNNIDSGIINELIIDEYKNDILDSIFQYYIFDTTFIFNMLVLYKNKNPISNKQLREMIVKEKGKIRIDESNYYCAIHGGNYDGVATLLNYDTADEEVIVERIQKYQLMEKAVGSNNHHLVRKLLRYNIHIKNINYKKLLLMAVENNNFNVLVILVDFLSDMIYDYYCELDSSTYIIMAISKKRNTEIMKFLVDVILNVIDDDLCNLNGYLIDYSNDIQFLVLILNIVIKLGDFQYLQYFINDKESMNSVFINSYDYNGECPIITSFYEITFHKNDRESKKYFKIFNYLLEYGADCNIKDQFGNSLLYLAIYYQEYHVINALFKRQFYIEKEAIIGSDDPLIDAIIHNRISKVKLLIDENSGGDYISRIDLTESHGKYGFTPLILSYLMNRSDIFYFYYHFQV